MCSLAAFPFFLFFRFQHNLSAKPHRQLEISRNSLAFFFGRYIATPTHSNILVKSNCTNRRLPGCVVMGINRTRRLFGRQKKDAWAASQYTSYGFRPRCYHFLFPLFLFFSVWSRKLHFRYAHGYFLDIYDTLEQSKELSRRGF